MNELNRYITDIASFYYELGLELDIINSQLKLIRDDPNLTDLTKKCQKMLEVWLENDDSATWKKLCDALKAIRQFVLAGKIRETIVST